MKLSEKIIILSFVYLMSIFFIFNFSQNETIAFCKNNAFAQKMKTKEIYFGLTENEIYNIVHELIPLIEGIAGKRFKYCPELKFVSNKKIENVLTYELILQFENVIHTKNKKTILKIARSKSKEVVKIILGKYGFTDKTIYLSNENINTYIKKNRYGKKMVKKVLTILIAHEMVHALQNQFIDNADRLKTISSFEQLDAMEAISEGHAVFIQDKIKSHIFSTQRLQLNKKAENYNSVSKHKQALKEIHAKDIYTYGKRFIEYWFNKGGNPKIWEAIQNPPARTSMILNPETYTHQKIKEMNYRLILEGLEYFFGPESVTTKNYDIPVLQFSSILSMLNFSDKDLVTKINHIQLLEIFFKINLCGTITFFKITDKTYGYRLKNFLETYIKNTLQKLNNIQDFTIKKISQTTIKKNKTQYAKSMITINTKSGQSQRTALVFLMENPVVLEINEPLAN